MERITPEHIDKLFAFTRKHLVEYYDVQLELVDHLANAIEEQWKENKNLPFEQVLEQEYKKFGVFGFSSLVEQKQAALQKHYWQIIKNEMRTFFSIPKIFLSLLLLYSLFRIFTSDWMYIEELRTGIHLGLVLFTAGIAVYQYCKMDKKRKWLIQSVGFYLYSLPATLMVWVRPGSSMHLKNSLILTVFDTVVTGLFVLFLMVLYFKVIPLLKREVSLTEKRYQF